MRPLVAVADAGRSSGGLAEAAARAVAVARRSDEGALVVELSDEERRRRPTLLASDAARDLERAVRALPGGERAVARGSLCWLKLPAGG